MTQPLHDFIPTVHQAWTGVMRDVQHVGKTGTNEQQHYKFRGVDAVVNAAGPALRKHGVIVVPSLRSWDYGTVEVGSKRTLQGHARVEVDYTVVGPSGDTLPVGSAPGEAMDSGDKATAKAMSVAYRTFLIQALALPTDEPDPDEHTYERAERPTVDELVAAARKAASLDELAGIAQAAVQYLTEAEQVSVREVYATRRAELVKPSAGDQADGGAA